MFYQVLQMRTQTTAYQVAARTITDLPELLQKEKLVKFLTVKAEKRPGRLRLEVSQF